jgi:N6-adenosine-specific RNA methylase IME4
MNQTLTLGDIRTDGGTQTRAQLDEAMIATYAGNLLDGDTFPAVVVFFDGESHWLADGFHRVEAFRRADRESIECEVHQGDRRAALLHAVSANAKHGLNRTNADKRRAVEMLLADEEWGHWSDREIARRCRVDHKSVGAWRAELTGEFPSERTYINRHGDEATMNVTNLAARNEPPETLAGAEPDEYYASILKHRTPSDADMIEPDAAVKSINRAADARDRKLEREAKMRQREEMHRAIAARNDSLDFGDRRFAIILADPPWSYENQGVNGAAENHYPVMPTEAIAALPVARAAALPDSVIFLWATNALLDDAKKVMAAWGFDYKTNFVWDKRGDGSPGMGWYNFQDHELLLVGVRGGGMTPVKRFSSVIVAPKGRHSEKPELAFEMLAAMYPGAPALEMFARKARPGWEAWGNQAPVEETGAIAS